jgi:hypothetical protein
MPGVHHNLKANYSIETSEGFARLSRMAGRDYSWPPPNTGNVNEDIMIDAVYGGSVEPDAHQEFAVFNVDWLDEHPEDAEELDQISDTDQIEQVRGRPVEEFTRYLDETFPGWVYHHERGEVYVVLPEGDEGRAQERSPRR